MPDDRIKGVITVDHPPDASGISDVAVEETLLRAGDVTGFLCRANGSTTVPNGHDFIGVYAKVLQQNPNPAWTRDQLIANAAAEASVLGTGNTWNMNQSLTALCNPSTPYPDNWFLSVSVTRFFDPGSEDYVFDGAVTSTAFKGKQVSSCTSNLNETTASTLKASKIKKDHQLHPVRRSRGWLLYRGLDPSLVGPGNVLMWKGKPLRASVLAIAAAKVFWEHQVVKPDGTLLKRGFVRRAVGDLIAAPDHFFVPGAPQYALLAMQETSALKPFVHVIASEDRKRPDFVHLNSEKYIRIQVNYNPRENVRTGTFDLWVKVIAE